MRTRRAFLAGLLGLAGAPRAPSRSGRAAAEAGEFYLKVLHVDRLKGELEAELSTVPRETRILFAGEVGAVLDGEFVKFEVRNRHWNFGGKEMKVEKVTWIF